MSALLPLLEAFLFEKALSSNLVLSHKSKAGFILLGLAVISLIGAFILAIIGSYHWLTLHYDADTAALAAAGLAFLVSAILGLIGFEMINKKKSRLKAMQEDLTDSALGWFETVADELHLPEAVRNHPKTTLVVSSIVGYLIARKIL